MQEAGFIDMPTYEYQCLDCGYRFERFQMMNDEPVKICPKCHQRVRRLIGTGGGIIFKGPGFYATDYRKPDTSQSGQAGKTKEISPPGRKSQDKQFQDKKTDDKHKIPEVKDWLPVLFWAGFIFFVSSLPGENFPSFIYARDIIFHIFEYAFLAVLLGRALKNSAFNRISQKPIRILLVILSCLIYAFSDEFHQQFVSGRISSTSDVLIDSLGIILGCVIYR
jgi:putative FmdB family regulatory protein